MGTIKQSIPVHNTFVFRFCLSILISLPYQQKFPHAFNLARDSKIYPFHENGKYRWKNCVTAHICFSARQFLANNIKEK